MLFVELRRPLRPGILGTMSLRLLATVLLGAMLLPPRNGFGEKPYHTLGTGARYHQKHTAFAEYPFGKGDLSYGLVYEFHEENAYWQVACGYASRPSGTPQSDYAVTPQVNLIIKDRIWRGGLGVAWTYVAGQPDGSGWTDFYWQFLAGISMPVVRLPLSVLAYYPFDRWSNLDEFDFRDVEYGVWVHFRF